MAAAKPKQIELGLTDLQLNPNNPRLGAREDDLPWTQPNLLEYYANRTDVRDLAKDIAVRGTNPSKRLIVEASGAGSSKYVVLEGNRRLAALRLLREPALAGSAAAERAFRSIKKLVTGRLPNSFDVVVIPFDDAKHWLEIEHARDQGGRATVPWGAGEHSRFSKLIRGSARHGRSIALLDLLKERGLIDAVDFKKVPVTTLDRIIGDRDVRERLGWTEDHPPLEESGDALVRIVKDLAAGMRVQHVFDKKKRAAYLDDVLANPNARLAGSAPAKAKQKRSSRSASDRTTLIPSTFACKSQVERTKEIVKELKNLPVHAFENSASIVMRTLLELALKEYIHDHSLVVKETAYGYDMVKAITACCDSIIARGTVDKKALRPLRDNVTQDYHFLSIKSFHGFAHDQYARPTKRELLRKWDECEAFFEGTIGAKR